MIYADDLLILLLLNSTIRAIWLWYNPNYMILWMQKRNPFTSWVIFQKAALKIFPARDTLCDKSKTMAARRNSFETYVSESVQTSTKGFLPQNPGRKISRNITISNIKTHMNWKSSQRPFHTYMFCHNLLFGKRVLFCMQTITWHQPSSLSLMKMPTNLCTHLPLCCVLQPNHSHQTQ